VRTQVDRDLAIVSRVDRRLGLIKNLGCHIGWTTASSTSFPLGEPSHEKSLPRTTSLHLARQVQAPTGTWARAHYSGGVTDVWGGANLHVTRKQQLAAMQAARPGKSLNAGLTSRATITSTSSPTLPHARLNPRQSSTLYDAHKPRLRLGRGELASTWQTKTSPNYSWRRPSVRGGGQLNPATRRLPRQGITTRLHYIPTVSDVRRDMPAAEHCNSFIFPLVPLPLRL
jgi:hypothetical protein